MSTSLRSRLATLLDALPVAESKPWDQGTIKELVETALSDLGTTSAPENRKTQWEILLRQEFFNLARDESRALKDPNTLYYARLRLLLDVTLAFAEAEALEQQVPFEILRDMFETHTIQSCSHIFSWIEERSARLTAGMAPQKGKSLILLRTLNDLLRRLSKMGSTTIFCGRILTFLSGVFPLGERSGVNLRGEYGPTWEGVHIPVKPPTPAAPEPEPGQDVVMTDKKEEEDGKEKMDVDGAKAEDKNAGVGSIALLDSTQRGLSVLQHVLVAPTPIFQPTLFSQPGTIEKFQEAVNIVLPAIKEATAKERAMMGSRGGGAGSLKRKRETEPATESSAVTEYFFAKFLTSPDLLELEIADTQFRRQVLFQLAVLLAHLQTFTKAEKATWVNIRNRSLHMDFTLEPPQAEWAQETFNKVMDELKQTAPNGRAFAETTSAILEREKNWVKWKCDVCAAFDKDPWSTMIGDHKVGLEEATREVRLKMRERLEEFPHEMGSASLTEIWQMGYRGLEDVQMPFRPGDVSSFLQKIKREDARIEMRQKRLDAAAEHKAAMQAKLKAEQEAAAAAVISPDAAVTTEDVSMNDATPAATASAVVAPPIHPSLPAKPGTPALSAAPALPDPVAPAPAPVVIPVVAPAPSTDEMIIKFEENKQREAWLALRAARDQHLQHFGKIGTGDIELLVKEIEAEAENAGIRQPETNLRQLGQKHLPRLIMSATRRMKVEAQQRQMMEMFQWGRKSSLRVEQATSVRFASAFALAEETDQSLLAGSHVIYTLQKTRRYKVISIDNGHNSHPNALARISALSRSELPENTSERDIETTEIESYSCDLTRKEDIRGVFEKYGKGGIWVVVHIAAYKPSESRRRSHSRITRTRRRYALLAPGHGRVRLHDSVLVLATVYGIPPEIPISETTRLKADSPYGRRKSCARRSWTTCARSVIGSDVLVLPPLTSPLHPTRRWSAISLRYFKCVD
ncbi:unnamed protein product [Mycena citricolor]|uniref:NAD-dependent epimerase/dehydratase domain-containing protein n=1 Tax=Mycena citricolor TaxID=2018698 RepID=A0AAD2GXX1_9AGAR|nr:unnamed protein product [Mycena citricolor]